MAERNITMVTIYSKGEKSYNIPFPFLDKLFVKCNINRVPLEYLRDYTINGQTLTLTDTPQKDDEITIYRETVTDKLVSFSDGSPLTELDLTTAQTQILHILEELFTLLGMNTVKQLQLEKIAKMADGVSCKKGQLVGYSKEKQGFILADFMDYKTLGDVCIAMTNSNKYGEVHVLMHGKYKLQPNEKGYNEIGATVFVDSQGSYRTIPPEFPYQHSKVVGYIEREVNKDIVIQFRPDNLAVQIR